MKLAPNTPAISFVIAAAMALSHAAAVTRAEPTALGWKFQHGQHGRHQRIDLIPERRERHWHGNGRCRRQRNGPVDVKSATPAMPPTHTTSAPNLPRFSISRVGEERAFWRHRARADASG